MRVFVRIDRTASAQFVMLILRIEQIQSRVGGFPPLRDWIRSFRGWFGLDSLILL